MKIKKSVKALLLGFMLAVSSVGIFCVCACDGISNSGDNNGGNGGNNSKAEFSSGAGTETDPYVISQSYQWANINKYPTASYVLSANINLGDMDSVQPVGNSTSEFSGTIDGKGYYVGGAKVKSTNAAGLFGMTSGATIKNLGFVNSTVHMQSKEDTDYMGSFVARAKKGTVIENCYSNNVSLSYTNYSTKWVYMGGFAGSVESMSKVVCCNSNVKITPPEGKYFRIGGFAVLVSGAEIDCCYAKGSINAYGPSGKNVCRIGTFIDSLVNGKVSNMYVEMNIQAKGSIGVYTIAGNVDSEPDLNYLLNFSDYQGDIDGRYETCKLYSSGGESVNIYFTSSQYAEANATLDNSPWQDNKCWKKGTVHPELISYQEYMELKALQLN